MPTQGRLVWETTSPIHSRDRLWLKCIESKTVSGLQEQVSDEQFTLACRFLPWFLIG